MPVRESTIRPGEGFVPFSGTATEQSLPARFGEQVARRADHPAVVCRGRTISYRELDRRANGIAQWLVGATHGGPQPIGLLFDQGVDLVAAILGVLKAGHFYLALDGGNPPARLSALLEHSGARFILCDGPHQCVAQHLVGDDHLVTEMVSGHTDEFDSRMTSGPDSLAYLFHTSGSTGQPKAVIDSHRNVLHNVMRYTNALQIGSGDRLTLLQAAVFSGSVSSLFGALLNGATSFLIDPARETPRSLARWVNQHRLTMWHSVPSLFRLLCASGDRFPSLRVVRLEGDQAVPADVRMFQKHCSRDCVLANGLGATESGLIRQFLFAAGNAVPESVVPVGYPVQDMDVTVVDEAGRQVRAGEVGEITVTSRYLARGYWKNTKLTASRFLSLSTDPSLRTYRTGDLGRLSADGRLDHLGRVDLQIKIGGHHIDVAELEAALAAIAGIREAIVIAVRHAPAEARLTAYLVADVSGTPGIGAIRRRLAARFPASMIPSSFVFLDALPLNANGKVDRRSLPVPDAARPSLDTAFVAPRNTEEQRIAGLWRQILGIDRVGIDDDFFDLGGTSLDAIRIVAALHVPADVFLGGPTIRQLAQPATSGCLAPIRSHGTEPPIFCAPGHDGMLFGFANLSRQLPASQPLFGLTAPGIREAFQPYTVPQLAARYVDAVRRVQPGGPYRLAGHCFGGLVVYEMACQLANAGEHVEWVALIECYCPRWQRRLPLPVRVWQQFRHAIRRITFHTRAATQSGAALAYVSARKRAMSEHRKQDADRRAFESCLAARQPVPLALRDVRFANQWASERFDPQSYCGRVLLFEGAAPRAGEWSAPQMGWKPLLAGEVRHVVVDDHLDGLLAEPAVRAVAGQLRSWNSAR